GSIQSRQTSRDGSAHAPTSFNAGPSNASTFSPPSSVSIFERQSRPRGRNERQLSNNTTHLAVSIVGLRHSRSSGSVTIRMERFIEKIRPNVSDTWRADEVYMKFKGDMRYLFALMDDETRYWIAQDVAGSKEIVDARVLFRKGQTATGKKPKVLITDGLKAY